MKFTKAALVVFLVLALSYAYFYQEPGSNGDTRLALTMAIVKQRRLNIDTFNAASGGFNSGDVAFYQGKTYTDKPIGSSVLGALVYYPLFRIMRILGIHPDVLEEKQLLTFLIIGLPSAVAGTLMYILCEYLSRNRFRAFIVTLAIGLGTMCFPFSVIYFGHQLAASLLFCAFIIIFQMKIQPGPPKIHNLPIFLAGLLMGLAFITDLTTVVIVIPLVGYYFYVLWTRKLANQALAWIIPFLGGLIPLLLMAGYNIQVYGSPFASGYQYLLNTQFKEGMANGLMGIGFPRLEVLFYETLHPAQGIFWQSPVLIMVFVGGFFMFRNRQVRAELAVAGAACAAYLLINSGYYMWWGGWSFGARLIVPMLPFLCLPLIYVPKKIFPLVIGLTAVSVAQMGIVAASIIKVPDGQMVQINQLPFFQYSTILNDCLKALIEGRFAWNMGQAWFGLQQWTSLLPISLVILIVTLGFAQSRKVPEFKV